MKKIILLFLQLALPCAICHAQTPNWLWAVGASGGACWEQGFGISSNPSGKVYMDARTNGTVTLGGQTESSGEGDLSGEMDSAGHFIWLKFHTYGTFDYTYAFASDKEDNCYTGGIINSGGSGAYFDKYDSAGNQVWSFTYPYGPSPYGLATDNAENVYMTGGYSGTMNFGTTSITTIGAYDVFLAKYDSNGTCKWAVTAGGSGQNAGGRGVAVDKAGNVYICGSYQQGGSITFGSITTPLATSVYPSFFIAKYDSSGNFQWVSTATNAGYGTSYQFWNYNGIAVDTCGNVYVTGHFIDTAKFGNLPAVVSAGAEDIFVAKCLTNGQWEWVQSGGGSGSDEGEGVTIDKHSDVYITGYFQNTAQFGNQSVTCNTAVTGGSYMFVAKYANSNGDLLWVQAPSGTASSGGQNLSVDKYGYVYVIGTVGGNYDPSKTNIFGQSSINDPAGCGSIVIAKLDTIPPRTITPFVSKSYCPGETVPLPYIITGTFDSGNTFTAQLSDSTGSFANAQNIGDITSTTDSSINITIPIGTTPGTYLIRVVSDSPSTSSWANGCGAYFVNNVYVNDFYVTIGNSLSISVLQSADTVCSGHSVLLTTVGDTSLKYKWTSNWDTTAFAITDTVTVNPTATTTYYVTVGNGFCNGKDSIIVTTNSAPALNILPLDTGFCSGQSATLYVSGGGIGFIWSPTAGLSDSTASGDSVLASPTMTTTYTVTGTSSGGCASTGEDIVTVIPSPNKPSFTQDGDTLISSSKYDNQWYRNDSLLVNDTSQHLIITILGEYLVNVTNEANGCSTSSDSMKVDSITGINQLSAISNQISIYPNPFSNDIFIKINSSAENVQDWNLQVSDVLGRIVYNLQSLNYSNDIDLSNLANGVYFITVINKTGRAVIPIVKQN